MHKDNKNKSDNGKKKFKIQDSKFKIIREIREIREFRGTIP